MIKFKNNTTKLKEIKNDFSDLSPEINKIMGGVINEIKSKLESSEHNAEVVLTGKVDAIKLSVKSESSESANILEKLIGDYLK
jgi:ABC-type molybdenum transport system ATPase subunit/photorepair protein PhrA